MTKFTERVAENIAMAYGNGLPLKYCAQMNGVDPATLWRWRKKGAKAKSGKYKKFYDVMVQAKANYIMYHLQALNNSDNDNTHFRLLETADPDEFSIKNKIEHSGEVTNINKNIEIDTDLLDEIIAEKREKYKEITDND